MTQFPLFQSPRERLTLGVLGSYPDHLVESIPEKRDERHPVNENLTRPWMKHFFLMQQVRESGGQDEILGRDTNLLDILKATIPLPENSFIESTLSSWRLLLDSAYREGDASWYGGIRKVLVQERFFAAIEQLELEMPESNIQRSFQFHDQTRVLRKFPRIPIKLFFSLPGNEKEKCVDLLRLALRCNPHNTDLALLTFLFFKAWGRAADFLTLTQEEQRPEMQEWYYWVENDMKNLAALKQAAGDHATLFYVGDRAMFTIEEYRELAEWFLKESEFKSAYHFYYKAKEFETALEILQNISVKEFAELTNWRRISRREKPYDLSGDTARFGTLYQEEVETLRGFARIRAAEMYRQVAVKARQHFDRETIETKYAFGELSEDEYGRLIRQLQERKQ